MTNTPSISTVVERVSQLLLREIGLRPEPNLRGRLARSICHDADARGQGLETYIETLSADVEAMQSLVDRVTVQESAFFRHAEHFDVLAKEVLPGLPRPVRIWSAACANGQEAVSLAMLLDELGVDGTVIASDLSPAAVRRTARGRYSDREVANLSPERIARHLSAVGDGWQVNKRLLDRVSTLRHNLLDAIPKPARTAQVVFCRNVLIYLSEAHCAAFLGRLADALPGTYLFLGAAESVWQLSDRFETVRIGDTFSYRARPVGAGSAYRQAAIARGAVSGGAVRAPAVRAAQALPTRPRPPVRPAEDNAAKDATKDAARAAALTQAGHQASATGEHEAAVIAFRKCAYLAPDDPIAHLHLGLALESAGHPASAQRAYAAARQVVAVSNPAHIDRAIGGYTTADLIRFLDSKHRARTP
jgi:chemotaxis protein methyltransferase CheR